MNNVSIIIPARYASSRYPGKPLALINGKPMILHVCDGCAPAFGKEKVYVVTDDDRIKNTVENAGYKVFMTAKEQVFHTGSDRVSYASQFVDSDYIINVQGDEPLVNAEDIVSVYGNVIGYGCSVVNCWKKCVKQPEIYKTTNGVDYMVNTSCENKNEIKVITSYNCKLLYMSRSPIPFKCDSYKKQVCIYGYDKDFLQEFFGEDKEKTALEKGEDIEILRFVSKGYGVRMIEVTNEYQSVDVPGDIEKVERILNEK